MTLPISIGILSWHNPKTLRHTLESYRKNGLLELSNDICILFQEVTAEDEHIAAKFGIKTIGLKENIGIGKAIEQLLRNAKYEHVLFLENDWQLTEGKETTQTQLAAGLALLKSGYQVIKYRSRKNPGHPLYSTAYKGRELDYYDDWHEVTSPHLLESLHWLDPAERFPDKIQKHGNFFVTTARWANWSNNPFLVHKDFYLGQLLPFAGSAVQFEKNIAPWWVRQDFKIAHGEGLFTHNDLKKYPPKPIHKRFLAKIREVLNRKKTPAQ